MSAREKIAKDIVKVLQAATTPTNIKHVTREPFDFDKLSNAQYPAILVRTTSEDREDSSIGGSSTSRIGSIDYDLVCYVKGRAIDTARNQMVETVEEALDTDRKRDSNAIDTQIINVEVDDGSIAPVGGVIITLRVIYSYTRGTT
ncbi:MAG: hypothetical protein Unbinned2819contig1003_34 [Prokaryotic dsDNA virus sp.]|nr:MAG: hypothetical protein Unbinned2819contig1003_34 [Prokaryotic dsDNA virus sp.]|tara:strand:- start:29511 stop:29945 length:435 start_codon:yes stop_codon:yes gene_type:complete